MKNITNYNNITLMLCVLILLGCTHKNTTNTAPLTTNIGPNIFEGVGIENIVVGQSSKSNVIAILGEPYRLIEHNTYSFEMTYEKLGLSFYYRYEDPQETIFCISIRPPFIGMTTKGIVLGESTMQDVVATYGQPTWRTSDVSETWSSEYPGIEFHVEMDPTLPRYPLNKEVHINRTIVKINIVE